jgi:TM2 domain-containing membrane protein YozV
MKSKMVALALCLFVGYFGAHRFYLGKIGTGVAQLLTFGGLGIWMAIDLILIALGKMTDSEGRELA